MFADICCFYFSNSASNMEKLISFCAFPAGPFPFWGKYVICSPSWKEHGAKQC